MRNILKIIFIILVILAPILFFLIPRYESSKSQLALKGIAALEVKEKKYFPPREWHSEGGGNPINFWSWAADPTFTADPIIEDEADLKIRYQVIYVNRTWNSDEFRSRILVVQLGGETFRYDLKDLDYLDRNNIYLASINDDELIFLEKSSYSSNEKNLLFLKRPLSDQSYRIISGEDPQWQNSIKLVSRSLVASFFQNACGDDGFLPRDYLKVELGIDCQR